MPINSRHMGEMPEAGAPHYAELKNLIAWGVCGRHHLSRPLVRQPSVQIQSIMRKIRRANSNADKVDRAVHAVRDKIGQRRRRKAVNSARHFTCRHRKLTMTDFADPADVASDRNVIGRVGEDHFGPFAVHQIGEYRAIQRVAASSA